MNRRDFLRIAGGGVLGSPLVFSKNKAFAQALSPISMAKHSLVASVNQVGGIPNMTINRWALNMIVDKMILQLTGKSTVGQAWESLFPAGSLNGQTKISIKVNNALDWYTWYHDDKPPNMCPYGNKAPVSEAIISGLIQMLDGTFPIENITVFDKQVNDPRYHNGWAENIGMTRQGYPPSQNPVNQCYSYTGVPGTYNVVLTNVRSSTVMAGMPTFDAGTSTKVPQVVSPEIANADFWINVFFPREHPMAGYTGAMKNCYGCTNNCAGTHPSNNSSLIHECIPDFYHNLNAITPCVLNMIDGLAGLLDGNYSIFYPSLVAASTDPLTIEYMSLELLNAARHDAGLHAIQAIKGTNGDGHVNAYSLALAQNTDKYSLGNFNAGNRILSDLSAGIGPRPMRALQIPQGRIASLERSTSGWRLWVQLDDSHRNHRIESRILDIMGREVKSFPGTSTRQSQTALEWNGQNGRGLPAPAGAYCWQVRINGATYNQKVLLK